MCTALNGNAGVLDNIVVVRRHIIDLPAQKSHPANKRYLDIDSDDETHQALLEKYQFLVARVERIVSTESILKWSTSLSDMEASQQGGETSYVKALCRRVEQKLKAAISRMVERQTSVDPYIAAGQSCRPAWSVRLCRYWPRSGWSVSAVLCPPLPSPNVRTKRAAFDLPCVLALLDTRVCVCVRACV